MRYFYTLAFKPEGKIGTAVETSSYELGGLSPLALKRGHRLGKLPDGVVFRVDRSPSAREKFDVVVNSLGWTILSEPLIHILKKIVPDDIEVLPVRVVDSRNNQVYRDFFVVNALQMVDALSQIKTVRSPVKIGKMHPVLRLAIVAAKVPVSVHLFRIKDCSSDLLIDNGVKRALSEVPHDGLAFIPVEQE